MAAKETARERLDRIEALLPSVLVQIDAMRILLELLLDIDFERYEGQVFEPDLFEIQERLSDLLAELDPATEEVGEQIRIAAITSAMLIADRSESEVIDIEIDDGREPANDD